MSGVILAFGWYQLKKRAAKTPTKIDDKLIKLVEEVVAKHKKNKKTPDPLDAATREELSGRLYRE